MIRLEGSHLRRVPARAVVALAGLVIAAAVACGGEDRPGSISIDPESETVSVSGVGSGTVSGLGASAALGGYQPVSDVSTHSKVSFDVAFINQLLGVEEIDFAEVRRVYENGMHSVTGVGTFRTIAGFANNADRSEAIWDDYKTYFGDPVWLHTFITDALEGTGPFEGEPAPVRRQGVQKGIQNQIMVAWTIHELVAALEKAEAGNLDPGEGAPHNWDEAAAFYVGLEPAGAPFATADKRDENFGRGAATNDAILAALAHGQQELLEGEVEEAREDFETILSILKVTYTQAAIRYANEMAEALEAGDAEKARIEQAEGWAFFRVIEPLVAQADAGVAAQVASYFDLANQPSEEARTAVPDALGGIYAVLGITAEQVGELQ